MATFAGSEQTLHTTMRKTALALCATALAGLPALADNWMKDLPDDAPVCALSIPGAHDAATGHGFISSAIGAEFSTTQDLTMEEMWELGVRAFDLRPCALKDNGECVLRICHGITSTNLLFTDAMDMLCRWLDENPSEFVVLHVRHESDLESSDCDYEAMMHEYLDGISDHLVDFRRDLTVGDMRGKILMLFRDSYTTKPTGGLMTGWAGYVSWDAQTNGKITAGQGTGQTSTATLYMQDFSDTSGDGDVDVKVQALTDMLDWTTQHYHYNEYRYVWTLNFASAYSQTWFGISLSDGYRDNATYTNAAIADYLGQHAGPTGIILADYVGVDTSDGYATMGKTMVEAVIANNFKYLTPRDEGDLTALLGAYDATDGTSGWTVSGVTAATSSQHWSGDTKDVYFEQNGSGWGSASKWSDTMTQTLSLPNGVYRLTAAGRSSTGAQVTMTANGSSYAFPAQEDTGGTIDIDGQEWASVAAGTAAGATFANDGKGRGWNWGSLTVTVTDGTLTVGATLANTSGSMYQWCSIDDFRLFYLGETMGYNIGQPTASETTVAPGQTLTISYADCTYADDGAQLSATAQATLSGPDGYEATLTLQGQGGGKYTLTLPDDLELGQEYTLTLAEGAVEWTYGGAAQFASPEATITLRTTELPVGTPIYLYSIGADKLLSRGHNYDNTNGYAADVDEYGLPVELGLTAQGTYTVKYIDSQLYLGGTWWVAANVAEASAAAFTLVTEDGRTAEGKQIYRFRNGSDSSAAAGDLYVNNGTGHGPLGFNKDDGAINSEADRQWLVYTRDERDSYKEANTQAARLATARAYDPGAESLDTLLATLSRQDMTAAVPGAALATEADLKCWREGDITTDGTGFKVGDGAVETFEDVDSITQTIAGLPAGIYRVTLQGFNRLGTASNIHSNNVDDYDLSLATLSANADETNLKPWAADRQQMEGESDYGDPYPDSMKQAAACFAQGLYQNEVYTCLAQGDDLTITIDCPDYLGAGWLIFTNLTLTWYGDGEPATLHKDPDTSGPYEYYGTFSAPQACTLPSALGLTAHTAKVGEAEADGPRTAQLTPVSGGELAARTGYLLTLTSEQDDLGETITYYLPASGLGTAAPSGNDLIANVEESTAGADTYALGYYATTDVVGTYKGASVYGVGVGFYHKSGTLNARTAYLQLTDSDSGAAPAAVALSLRGGDQPPTGVQSPAPAGPDDGAPLYDLSGRRVQTPAARGIYITNGRKVVR